MAAQSVLRIILSLSPQHVDDEPHTITQTSGVHAISPVLKDGNCLKDDLIYSLVSLNMTWNVHTKPLANFYVLKTQVAEIEGSNSMPALAI